MKKAIAIAATIGVLLTTGILSQQAQAKSDHVNNGQKVKKSGLENALDHVKNERAREAIRRAMERKANKKEDSNEHNKQLTDLQRVEKDKQALVIDYGGSDKAESVTVPFDSLPNRGAKGSIITWISSNTAVISNDGKTVNRPSIISSDILVTLTATVKYGDASATKSFTVTVIHL